MCVCVCVCVCKTFNPDLKTIDRNELKSISHKNILDIN